MYQRPHWSYSSLNQYLRCPLQFFFERVLGLPRPTIGSGLVLGSAVHSALETYHLALKEDRSPNHDQIRKSFIDAWESREAGAKVTFKAGDSKEDAIAMGVALIELYLKEPPPTNIIAVEQRLIAPVRNSRDEYLETPIVSVADLITEENDTLKIKEFKTSGRAYSAIEAETSLQPTCYVNAVHEVYGRSAEVDYTVLVKTKTPKIQKVSANRLDEELGRLGDIVETIERAVQTNVFYPVETPMNCSTCPFRGPCREWGRKQRPPAEAVATAKLNGTVSC